MWERIIIGAGEVGQGLHEVIGGVLHDPPKGLVAPEGAYDEVHICFPYTPERFESAVEAYREEFKPQRLIIHSTVPVGTSRKLNAVHSPVRGVHPNIALGIRTFVKYVGGEGAREVADVLEQFSIRTHVVESPEATELLKLLDTTQYGFMILVNRWCEEQARKHGVELETVYAHANRTYNEGYRALGMEHVVRPYLRYMPGPIGGHCVRENARLLDPCVSKMLEESR